jgi:hypothetical protein
MVAQFFFNGKYIIIIKNQISAQDEQRSVKRSYRIKASYISGIPINIPKQILSNIGSLLILFLE